MFTPTGQPAIDRNTGDLTYTPAANANGTVTFNVAVRDTGGGDDTSAALPATFTINAVNDAPVITLPMTAPMGSEDQPLTIAGISISDVDAGAESLLVNLSIKSGSISLFQAGGLAFNDIDGSDGTLEFFGSQSSLTSALQAGISFMPAPDFHGVLILNIAVDDLGKNGDGGAKSAAETLQITITPDNDPPTIQNAAFSLAENSPNDTLVGTTIGSDPEQQPFTGAIAEAITSDAAETRHDRRARPQRRRPRRHRRRPCRRAQPALPGRRRTWIPSAAWHGRPISPMTDRNDTRAVVIARRQQRRPSLTSSSATPPTSPTASFSTTAQLALLSHGVTGVDVTADAHDTRSLALADLNGDTSPRPRRRQRVRPAATASTSTTERRRSL